MKKIFALACATSVLALASGAWAQQYQVNLSGTVQGFCTVGAPVKHNTGVTTDTGGTASASSASFTFASDFSNASGILNHSAGNVDLPVTTNHACNYVLSSANGGLQRSSGGPSIPYTAAVVAGDTIAAGPLTALLSGTGNQVGNALLVPADATNHANVTIGFDVATDGTTVYGAGTYTDQLTLQINPS